MALKRAQPRVAESSITSGAGPWTLAGALDASYDTFLAGIPLANGDTTPASVFEPGVAFWQGIATYNASLNQLSPTITHKAKGTFGSNTKEVHSGILAIRDMLAEDISGAIVTTGTAVAYAVSSFTVYPSLARLHGNVVAFTPHTTNGPAAGVAPGVTLNIDGLGAKPLRMSPGVELLPGTLVQGTPYMAIYNDTDGACYLHGLFGNTLGIPLGFTINGYGSSPPNSCFVAPNGQALSRTVYAALFAMIGTTFGSGNGTITFNIPDETGCVEAMIEASASRLTAAGWGGNSTVIGSRSGVDSHALTGAQGPVHNHTATSTDAGHSHSADGHNGIQTIGTQQATATNMYVGIGNGSTGSGNASITTTVNNAGSGNAHPNVQPTMAKSRYMRVL